MKTTVEHNDKEKDIKYPFIGIAKNKAIVLFYKERKGICLDPGDSYSSIGHYSETWLMDNFETLNGKITLEND